MMKRGKDGARDQIKEPCLGLTLCASRQVLFRTENVNQYRHYISIIFAVFGCFGQVAHQLGKLLLHGVIH